LKPESWAKIRPRVDADIEACLRLLAAVHARDHYPLLWPDDAAKWLSPRDLLGAWVAEVNGLVLGHVALTRDAGEQWAGILRCARAVEPAMLDIALITRLFVDPTTRRRGLGSDLLDAACKYATGIGLHPAVDVVESDRAAIALYEANGWVRVRTREWTLPTGGTTHLHHYTTDSCDLSPRTG
jgi:GNAT superfamily N-acetyltransferase